MYRIKHRDDGLLQRNVAKPLEESLKGTYIEKYTRPIHRALLKFLDQELIGRKFPDQMLIKVFLEGWPDFAFAETGITNLGVIKEWNRLYISEDNNICVATGGMGGDLWIASIEEYADDKSDEFLSSSEGEGPKPYMKPTNELAAMAI